MTHLAKNILRKLFSFLRNIGDIELQNQRLSTSLSDNQIYPDFCVNASLNSKVFSNFRRNPIYLQILEHVTKEEGIKYLDEIKENSKNLLDKMDIFSDNDDWGNPFIYDYSGIGSFSPSTLRYIKVYGDLKSIFNNLNNFKICEIGVGYGGQCRIINSGLENVKEYILVDIKPALMLAQCFLDKFAINSVLKFKTMNELEMQDYDLVISNYSFTELPRTIQDIYLQKVIMKSKRGYITYNDINPKYFNSYKLHELLEVIPNSFVIAEKPLTHSNNCIIAWS